MDPNTNLTQNIDALFTNLEEFTRNESILGKPVSFEGKTLIPVISVTVGYGSGNTPSKNQQNNTGVMAGMTQGMGALGLGARINTEAVVVIDNNNVSMLPITGTAKPGLMDKLPQMLSSLNMGGQQQNQQQNQQGQQGQQGQQQ
jgi:uncharacterized spore protein YtfJ